MVSCFFKIILVDLYSYDYELQSFFCCAVIKKSKNIPDIRLSRLIYTHLVSLHYCNKD